MSIIIIVTAWPVQIYLNCELSIRRSILTDINLSLIQLLHKDHQLSIVCISDSDIVVEPAERSANDVTSPATIKIDFILLVLYCSK